MPSHDAQRSGRNDFVIGPQIPFENWRYDAQTFFSGSWSPTVDSNGNVYFGTGDFSLWPMLHVVSPLGALKWWYPLVAPLGSGPGLSSNNYLFVNTGPVFPQASYLFKTTGVRQWTVTDYVPIDPIIGPDDRMYWTLRSQGGVVFQRNQDGSLVIRNLNTPTISPIIAGYDGALYAFKTGGPPQEQVSVFKLLNGKETTTPTLIKGQITYVVALTNGTFAAINKTTGYDLINFTQAGLVNWRVPLPGASDSSKLHSFRDGSILTIIGQTVTKWLPSGNIDWQKLTGRSYVQDCCLDARGTLYLLDTTGLTCLLSNGQFYWEYPTPTYQGAGLMGPAITSKGIVFGSTAGYIHSLAVEGLVSHTVRASITFGGIDPAATNPPVRVLLREAGSNITYANFVVYPNQDGSFDIPMRLASTDVIVKPAKWLSAKVANVDSGTDTISVTLKGGDLDNSNKVDIADLSGVLVAFTTPDADLNLDGTTDLKDLNLTLVNFGLSGEGL